MTEECVDNFVLSLDAIIRVGGANSNDDCDDAEQINAALASAGKKYGAPFQGEEAMRAMLEWLAGLARRRPRGLAP